MIAKTYTVAFQGIKAACVHVEVVISPGLPAFSMVGLADKAVNESKERIRACFHTLGLSLPSKKITVNLAPADLPKEGPHYDLPIAIGLLSALGHIDPLECEEFLSLGELSLTGEIKNCPGILPSALLAHELDKTFICPELGYSEAHWTNHPKILAPSHLLSLLNHFKGTQVLSLPALLPYEETSLHDLDFNQVKGQSFVKRALEISAAGQHNTLLIGPPGAGKSMLAKRFSTLLPALEPEEMLEVSAIHSLAGYLPKQGLITQRPFRDPHHSASAIALIGGGNKIKPGEISLAHGGVLFLDELPEFQRMTLEALRQPIETGEVLIARANQHVRFPAKFQLLAAMNPCRCGFLGDPNKECHRVPLCGQDYQNKLSGPLLDRFDIFVHVHKVSSKDLLRNKEEPENSKAIRTRIQRAIEFQKQRQKSESESEIIKSPLDALQEQPSLLNLAEKAIEKYQLSARGLQRLVRVSRTIADLEQCEKISDSHFLEALLYRQPLFKEATKF